MKLVMNTENARALAVAYGQQSDEALRLAQKLTTLLAEAVMDDTWDVAGSLNGLSEDLHLGDVVLRHQADIMDGLTVDVDALSQEMGVNRWKLDKRLKRVEWGQLDAGEVLISLVDFGKTNVTGLDTTIRDFVPDSPPIGTDPEFDAMIQRLDGWLLSAIVDGRSVDKLLTSEGRIEDLTTLADRLGLPDLSAVTVERTFTRERGHGRGDRYTESYVKTIPLPTSEYESYTADFLTDALIAERKLTRAAVLPTLGELLDFSTYQQAYRHKLGGGDEDTVTRHRTIERSAEEIAEKIEEANETWKHLAWLPAVLAGQAAPPANLETNRVLQNQLIKFAKLFGYGGSLSVAADGVSDPAASAPALDFMVGKGRDLLADSLENPRPIQKARLAMDRTTLENSIEFGRAQGVITEDAEVNARAIALHLSGLDIATDLAGLDPAALEAEVPELDSAQLVGLLATAIPPHLLTENRLIQAITYVSRADTVAERVERIERTILGLKTVTTVGEPAMTQAAWLGSLPKKVRKERFDYDIDGREFNWLLDHAGVPGYHKSPDWKSGGGKRYFHLVNEADGAIDDFIIEKIPKKKGWFGQAVLSIAKVAISIYFPPAGVAFAAMDAAIAASQGNWLGAGMAALGAVAAGTAAWASSATSTATQATNNVISAADALADGAGSLQALTTANQAFTAANSAANLANTAANAAAFANAGFRAGVAFSQDDILGGVVNSVTALGAGASTFGYGNVGQNLATTANAVERVDATIEAIEDDDIAGALAGGLSSASSLVDLSAGTGTMADTMDEDTAASLGRISTTLDDAADLTRAGGAIAKGIDDEEWASLVGSGLRFGSSAVRLAGNDDGVVAGMVDDRSDTEAFDAGVERMDLYRSWLDGAADLADGGLALAERDYLGGAALLSSGTSGLIRSRGSVGTNLERLDSITNIADKIVKAGPGLDHATTMGLIGPEMQTLVNSLQATDPAFTRSDDLEGDLVRVRAERQAAEAGLDTLDDLLAFDTTDGNVGALLGTTRSDLARDLSELELAEQAVAEDYRRELAARRASAAAQPSHVPVLKPPVPSHLPLARPDDLIPPGTQVTVMTPHGPVLMTPGPGGLLVPVESTGRGVTGPVSGRPGDLTPEQMAGLVDLARAEEVGAVEDRIATLSAQRNLSGRQARAEVDLQIAQLERRRDGLRLMAAQKARPEDYAQFDGSRFIVDDNLDATRYYYLGSEHDLSGGTGPRTPVVLGPATRQRLLDNPDFRTALYKIVNGSTAQPGSGQIGLDLEGLNEDFHIGDTQIEYHTTEDADGQLTTTFLFAPGDGIQDPADEFFIGPLEPIAPLFEDGLGPGAELGGRPYLYQPFSWSVTYPNHGHDLRGGQRILGPLPPRPGEPLPGVTIDPRSLTTPQVDLVIPPRPGDGVPNADASVFLPSPPRPDHLGGISFDHFPATHPARLYEDYLTTVHPGLHLPHLGDWNLEANVVAPSEQIGPYKVPAGFLGVAGLARETFADGRRGVTSSGRWGTRFGVDGPVPLAPAIQGGYALDHLHGGPIELFGTEVDLPGGGLAFQTIGPAPGVVPDELYSLTNPWSWPSGASVRLNGVGGSEHHAKIGNAGDARLSFFDDEIRHDLDFFQTTNQDGQAEIAQGPVEVDVSQPGVAVNFPMRLFGAEEGRIAGSYQFVDGEAALTSVSYGRSEAEAYRQHHLTGRPAPGRPTTYTDAIFGSHQGWLDFTAGPSSPRFDSSLNAAKLFPNGQWFVASSQLPDGSWRTDYSTGGRFQDRIEGSTTIGSAGSIDELRIASSVSPLFGDGIPFELDRDGYTAVLESMANDRDPLLALEGRAGVRDELFDDPITRAEFRDRLVDIQGMGELSLNHPIAGNLRVRETPRGEPILELANPYPAQLSREIADRWMLPAQANPPFRNTNMPPSEVIDGVIQGAGEVADGWADTIRYARAGTSKLAVLGLDAAGLGDWALEADRAAAAEFDAEYLDATLASGQAIAAYGASRWENWGLIPDDLVAVKDGLVDWAGETSTTLSTAWEDGDGEAIGRAAAHTLAFGAEMAVGAGAAVSTVRAGRAGRAASPSNIDVDADIDLGREPSGPDGPGRGGTGGGGGGSGGGDGPAGGGDRWVLPRHDETLFDGGADSAAAGDRLRLDYQFQADRQPVSDPGLDRLLSESHRDAGEIGNGSAESITLHETRTNGPVSGDSIHAEKLRNDAKSLLDWLHDNPDIEPGTRLDDQRIVSPSQSKLRQQDRRVAERTLRAHLTALEEVRDQRYDGPPHPKLEEARGYLTELDTKAARIVEQEAKDRAAVERREINEIHKELRLEKEAEMRVERGEDQGEFDADR